MPKPQDQIIPTPKQGAGMVEPTTRLAGMGPARALLLPLFFTLILFAFGLLPFSRENPRLAWSFWAAAAALLAWNALLWATAAHHRRTFTLEVVLRNQHYVQACAQLSVLVYWGWYWRTVYDSVLFIAAQLIFAYAVDALLTWSRRNTYTLGFGPFPIIFSINLFLWFKPDWFFLQFLLVAVGFAAKELLRWNKDGRRTHIFNPSSFPLALFSVVLILTNKSHLTWGPEISTTQLNPPYIYLLIFLVSLPGQYLFGVTLMTMSAVVTSYVFILLYGVVTGNLFFYGAYIPIAVFLGMHLLFNDPSTSPRSGLGRILFGVLYALIVIVLYTLFTGAGKENFYDKLLPVPILNLTIQGIDRIAGSNLLKRLDPTALVAGLAPRRRNLVYISMWIVLFAIIQLHTRPSQVVARRNNVGLEMLFKGQTEEAIAGFSELVRADPDNFRANNNLGLALSRARRYREAVAPLQRALELQPDKVYTHNLLAHALSAVGKPNEAVHHFNEAIRLRPNWSPPWITLAMLRATHPDPRIRRPDEAIRLGRRAIELTGRRDPLALDALAAAFAAAGRYEQAVRTAEEAEARAAISRSDLVPQINARLNLYRAGQPYVISGGK